MVWNPAKNTNPIVSNKPRSSFCNCYNDLMKRQGLFSLQTKRGLRKNKELVERARRWINDMIVEMALEQVDIRLLFFPNGR